MSGGDIAEILEKEGLSEYTEVLLKEGLENVSDLATVSEDDLKAIGIEKIFHRRKLLKLGGHAFPGSAPTAGSGGATVSVEAPGEEGEAGRQHGGDRVQVEVLGARANSGTFSEKEFYVKGVLCTYTKGFVNPIGTGQKTKLSRGPFPIWSSDELGSTTFEFPTDFRTQCIAFELKERRLITDNKVVGVVIFPPKFFHKFKPDTVLDNWWPLRMAYEDEGEVHAYLRLRFTIPGGCPQGAQGRIFHVKGVSMTQRKLRLTIFEGRLGSKANPHNLYGDAMLAAQQERKPDLYVEVELDNEDRTSWKTAIAHNTLTPAFDETFEYFMEVQTAKLLTIRLKEVKSLGDVTRGILLIPIQFFLCQKDATDVEEVHALHDEKDRTLQTGKLHVRLEVRQRQGTEKRVSFRRTRSIKEDVHRVSPSFEDEIGAVLVDDGEEDTSDEDA